MAPNSPPITEVIFPRSYWGIGLFLGDVDHESTDVFKETLRGENISLEKFLTDDAYVVIIDGDEYRVFHNLLKSKVVHLEDYEKFYGENYLREQER